MIQELMSKASARYPFGSDDFFQQVTGSAILTAPFLFTQEVWMLSSELSTFKTILLVTFSLGLGHGALYVASQKRDWEKERKLGGVTLRFISLMLVAYGTVASLMLLTGAPEAFDASTAQSIKVVATVSVFSVAGAATADNLV